MFYSKVGYWVNHLKQNIEHWYGEKDAKAVICDCHEHPYWKLYNRTHHMKKFIYTIFNYCYSVFSDGEEVFFAGFLNKRRNPAPQVYMPIVNISTTNWRILTKIFGAGLGIIWWHSQPSSFWFYTSLSSALLGLVNNIPIIPPVSLILTILFIMEILLQKVTSYFGIRNSE